MLHPGVSRLIAETERDGWQGWMPFISLLGPRGSGKSEVLREFLGELARNGQDTKGLLLDLRQFPCSPEPKLLAVFIESLREAARQAGMSPPPETNPAVSKAEFASLIRQYLTTFPGRLFLCIDHLDCVPRYFARSLSQQLRAIRDQVDVHCEYQRLGIVVAGALSLFELRNDELSPFMHGTVVRLPASDSDEQQRLVRYGLEKWRPKCKVSQAVVVRLAEITGGEQSFLEPILQLFDARPGKGHKLSQKNLEACLRTEHLLSLPAAAIRDVALQIVINEGVRKAAAALVQGGTRVSTVRRGAEVDELQLRGIALTTSRDGAAQYRIRNFLVEDIVRWSLDVLAGNSNSAGQESDLAREMIQIKEFHSRYSQALDLTSAARSLSDAWPVITRQGTARLFLAARSDRSDHKWGFEFRDGRLERVQLLAEQAGPASWIVARMQRAPGESRTRIDRHLVGADDEYSYAVSEWPVSQFVAWVVMAVPRSPGREPFSEVALTPWFDFVSSARDRLALLFSQEILRVMLKADKPVQSADPRKVFVVHGRNHAIRDQVFAFLRSIGLEPLEWSQIVAATGKGTPAIPEIIAQGFTLAQAVVVLLSGDDEVRLREMFRGESEADAECELQPQPRANVLYEAGMSMGLHPDRTILVKVGQVKLFSDIGGLHSLRLDTSPERWEELARRLKTTGCQVP
ncbi:MAG: nucleotide-binding protein [Pirellulaceae bacterium]|nr:nucleotide-binding protein [Pirellulaceae bacterium]